MKKYPYLPKFLLPENEESQELKREKCKLPLNQLRKQWMDIFWISYSNQTQFRAIHSEIIPCGLKRGTSSIHWKFPTTCLSSSPVIKMSWVLIKRMHQITNSNQFHKNCLYIRTLEKPCMIQAYEKPMAFTRNQTLNPVLVLSSKISLLFQLINF